MNTIKSLALWSLALVLMALPGLLAAEPDDTLALRGATVHTAVGPPLQNATILIAGGKIKVVGTDVKIPAGTKVLDVTGKVIIPGMIDNHSHLGIYESGDANEFPVSVGPEFRALDALDLADPHWMAALKGGVTTVITGPGSGEHISGQSITIKTFGPNVQERILREGGEVKMALSKRTLSNFSAIRATFIKAREYMESWQRYEAGEKKGPPPKRDLGLEAIAKVLKGEERVRAHITYAHDILSLLKIKDEFGFDLTLQHSEEAYKVADEIAKRDVSAVVMPIALRYSVREDVVYGNAILHKAGVKIAMHTDHPVAQQKWLRLCAATSMRYGLPEEAALKTVTINPAEMARISDSVGSIEKGKDADLVVFNGPWYALKSRVDMVFVNGVLAYDRAQEEKAEEEQ